MKQKDYRALHAAIRAMEAGLQPDLGFIQYFQLLMPDHMYYAVEFPRIDHAIQMRDALTAHIKQFSNDLEAFDHFREVYQNYKQGVFEPKPPKVKRTKLVRIGHIYLCRSAHHHFTKIGFSKQPTVREQTLQAEDPQLEIFFCSEYGWSLDYERSLHARFETHRHRGEWFNLSATDIDSLTSELSNPIPNENIRTAA
jgi:hypothetical protein